MRPALGMVMLVVVIASGIPAMAHHSGALYFDMTKAITLEGRILRVEWQSASERVRVKAGPKNQDPPLRTKVRFNRAC